MIGGKGRTEAKECKEMWRFLFQAEHVLHVIQPAGLRDCPLRRPQRPALPGIGARMDALIAAGRGADDLGALAADVTAGPAA